jgi:hypothetical protein
MLRFIVMHCGYAESNMTSALIYQCACFGNPGYSSYKKAITDLALDLYAKFYDEHLSIYENRYGRDIKDCCRKSLIANKETKFCSECGNQICDKKFDHGDFMSFVHDLHCSTCDSYGEAEYASGRYMTWYPYWNDDFIGAPKEDVIYIAELAEVILLAALYDAKPELRINHLNDDFDCSEWKSFSNEIQPNYR